ncbi:MAG: hypothetical protein HUK09_02005 [Bacteroidaceae bacterium]|nr:hypothetical protein [Bacteroidaceae bacterium]
MQSFDSEAKLLIILNIQKLFDIFVAFHSTLLWHFIRYFCGKRVAVGCVFFAVWQLMDEKEHFATLLYDLRPSSNLKNGLARHDRIDGREWRKNERVKIGRKLGQKGMKRGGTGQMVADGTNFGRDCAKFVREIWKYLPRRFNNFPRKYNYFPPYFRNSPSIL